MVDTLVSKTNPVKGIGSSPILGKYILNICLGCGVMVT